MPSGAPLRFPSELAELTLVMQMGWATLITLAALAVVVSAQGTLPPGAPSTITVQFIIRDFVGVCSSCGTGSDTRNKTTHRDFERIVGNDYGIVRNDLGADRVRVLVLFC